MKPEDIAVRERAAETLIRDMRIITSVPVIERNEGHSIIIYGENEKPVTFIRFADGDDRWMEEAEFYRREGIPHTVHEGQVFIASTAEVMELEEPME